MNGLKRFSGLVAASCLVFGACGGGSSDDSPDAGGNPNFDAGDVADAGDTPTPDADVPEPDAAPMLTGIDAVCATDGPFAAIFEKSIECNPQIGFINVFGTDLFGGESIAQVCLDNLQPQIDSATVTIDDSNMQACLDYITETECLELDLDNLDATPCGELFVGTIAVDGECDVDAQCIGDAFCQPDKGCGSCQNRLPTGASCGANVQCSDGTCDASNECAAPLGVGDTCTGNRDCGGLLFCSQASDTCEDPFPQVGDTCVADGDCGGLQFSLLCEAGATINDPSTCQTLPQPGEQCVPLEPIGGQPGCDLVNYVWCLPSTNECQAPTVSALGEPCHVVGIIGAGARQCAPGLACSDPFSGFEGAPGTCLAPGFQGDTCTIDTGDVEITEVCHPSYECIDGICEGDSDFTGDCPAP